MNIWPQGDKRFFFQIEKGKVALISGGGSGHEPFCAGYIGEIRDISEILVDMFVRQAYMDIYIIFVYMDVLVRQLLNI